MSDPKENITRSGDVVKVKAAEGYNYPGTTLCKLTNTGNGFVAKFPSRSSTHQTNYICLNYAEAAYLCMALGEVLKGGEV